MNDKLRMYADAQAARVVLYVSASYLSAQISTSEESDFTRRGRGGRRREIHRSTPGGRLGQRCGSA
jgi:hypothetical protein